MKPLKALISKSTIHRAHTDNMTEIKNFSYKDVITPGNVLLIYSRSHNTHHAIVVDNECAKQFVTSKYQKLALTLNTGSQVTYWALDSLDDNAFQKFNYGIARIDKVFKTNIDIRNIKSIKDLEKLYKEYNLIKIKAQ